MDEQITIRCSIRGCEKSTLEKALVNKRGSTFLKMDFLDK